MIAQKQPISPKRHRSPAKRRAAQRGGVLSIRQIESRYPSQWILVKDPVVDKHLRVIRGEVVSHSKDRDEVDRKAVELRLKRSAFLYTGKLPSSNAAILL